MSTKLEILRLKSLGHNKAQVAKKLNIQWRTVDHYWQSESPPTLDRSPDWSKEVDWKNIIKRYQKGAFATSLYEELKDLIPISSYDSFNRFLKKELKKLPPDIQVRIPKVPGKEVEVDYSGDSIKIISPATKDLINTELFVGCLPSSGYVYAEFTFTQKLDDFISSHCNMFEHFGGVPLFLVPDNAKVAVNKYHRYDPDINKTYYDMATHYKVGVSPARPRQPKDKASVERAVGLIQQHFFPTIKDKTFTSIGELNDELKIWLEQFNSKKMKRTSKSRKELFEEERKHLSPLSDTRYELFYWKKAKVHPDCHFQFSNNYYSVPSQYVGKEVDLRFNNKQVSAYLKGEKIYTHTILKGHGHFQTVLGHYPEKVLSQQSFSLAMATRDAKIVGENMLLVVNKLIEKGAHPLVNLRKIQGILRLQKKYSRDALEYACEQALIMDKLFYQYINNCAKNYYPEKQITAIDTPTREVQFTCLQGGYDND